MYYLENTLFFYLKYYEVLFMSFSMHILCTGKCPWSCSHHTCFVFLDHLQAHCLCVQVTGASQALHLHWWQRPVPNFDLAGQQAEVRWLLWKCWITFQQCFEGNWDKYSRNLPVLPSGFIWIRHKLTLHHTLTLPSTVISFLFYTSRA